MRRPKRILRRRGPDPSVTPMPVLAALSPDDRRRLLDALERLGPGPRPCAVCDAVALAWRPIVILEPDSRALGIPEGRSFVGVAHFCPRHDNQADAARFRTALIAEARSRPPNPSP